MSAAGASKSAERPSKSAGTLSKFARRSSRSAGTLSKFEGSLSKSENFHLTLLEACLSLLISTFPIITDTRKLCFSCRIQ